MRAKRAGKCFKLHCRERKIFGKFCTFPPNSSKLRSDYLFSFQKRTNYLFPAFSRSEYLFPKSVSSSPPLRIKWSSPECSNRIGRYVLALVTRERQTTYIGDIKHTTRFIIHRMEWKFIWDEEKKEEIWLSPMTKAPTPTEMSKGQSDNTNNATKKFD